MNVKNVIYDSIISLNNSKFFAGIVMIMLNIGSKYITIELSKTQEQFLKNSIARQLLIFSIVWMGTRDIFISLILTSCFIIMTDYLFNEQSKFCIVPKKLRALQKKIDTNNDNIISDIELNNALKILDKVKKDNKRKQYLEMANYHEF
jgi:hypothetical protein